MNKLSITIAHAAHVPERKATLGRMIEKLPDYTRIETTRGKPHQWSLAQWQMGVDSNATHCVFLNDDLILCDTFEETVLNVIAARPDHVINLYNTHPLAAEAYSKGLRWCTSPDGLIGNAYVLPRVAVEQFLEWREKDITANTPELLSEDQLLNLWVMSKHSLVWLTVPALVDHDTTVASLYGNQQLRKPVVGPKPEMEKIDWHTDAIHTGRTFTGNHWGLIRWMQPEKRDVEWAYKLHADMTPI